MRREAATSRRNQNLSTTLYFECTASYF
jgi:hypothetical protein